MHPEVASERAAPTDEALSEAARHGDREAFAELVRRYRAMAYACAWAFLRDVEDAEDVVQEAFACAFAALPRQGRMKMWSAWFMTIVRNRCRDVLRRRCARRMAHDPLEGTLPAPELAPEDALIRLERDRSVREAVEELPDVLRVPVVLHYGYGLTCREIAVALGVRPSTVTGRIAGALRRLRRRCMDGAME